MFHIFKNRNKREINFECNFFKFFFFYFFVQNFIKLECDIGIFCSIIRKFFNFNIIYFCRIFFFTN